MLSVLPSYTGKAQNGEVEEGRKHNNRLLVFLAALVLTVGLICSLNSSTFYRQLLNGDLGASLADQQHGKATEDVDYHRNLINDNYDNLPKLSELNVWDYLALIFMGLGLMLASAGGVGGGPMFVPILAIFLNFPLKRATPMSNVIIVGGGIANCAFNVMRAHPRKADRPVIDYDLVIIMVPAVMAGALTGVFISLIIPSYAVGFLMVGVLSFSAYKSILKGRNMRKKEQKAREEKALAAAKKARDAAAVADAPSVTVNNSELTSANGSNGTSPVVQRKRSVGEILGVQDMIDRTPWKKAGYLLACFLGIVAFTLGGQASGCGSAGYWVLYWIEVPWAAAFSIMGMRNVEKRHRYKLDNGIEFEEGDITFTPKLAVRFLLQCGFTGLMAGLFGIGGGVFIGPLLVEMKVLPQVASATTAVLVLFASSVAVLKFTIEGAIDMYSYTLLLFLMGLVITYLAQYFIAGYVRRTGAASIIVLSIGCSIAVGSVLMAYLSVVLVIENSGEGFDTNFCD